MFSNGKDLEMRLFGLRCLMAWVKPFAVVGLGIIWLATPGAAHGPGGKGSASFEAYKAGDISAKFRGLENPLLPTQKHALAGQHLYEANCVMCHGSNAEGNGHMAQMLEVKPADLRQMLRHFPEVEDYYYWIISEGGGRFNLPMPGFGESLSETEIWQLVTWMQAEFPGAGTDIEDRMPHQDHEMHDRSHPSRHHMDDTEHMPGMPRHDIPSN